MISTSSSFIKKEALNSVKTILNNAQSEQKIFNEQKNNVKEKSCRQKYQKIINRQINKKKANKKQVKILKNKLTKNNYVSPYKVSHKMKLKNYK